jgi:hypothetical protein
MLCVLVAILGFNNVTCLGSGTGHCHGSHIGAFASTPWPGLCLAEVKVSLFAREADDLASLRG